MKVQAATVEQHEFAVRRRGYDRAEVDAVIGQITRSLRSYEEEMGDLEARLNEAEWATDAITDSLDTHQTRETLLEQTRMESDKMMRQADEALGGAREKAEGILASARAEIDKLFEKLANETETVLAAAERDAAARRQEAEEESSSVLEDAKKQADALRQDAVTVKTEAQELRRQAEEEADALRRQAAEEAAATVERARQEHDRLATRIPELRSALSQFEAQVHALAAVDLNEIEATEKAHDAAEAPVPEVAQASDNAIDAPVDDVVPVPDGSGTLPAARDLVDLDEYRELKSDTAGGSSPETLEEVAEVAEPIPARATAPLERLASTHVASRGMNADNETIYQRRGGGLRRRINAQNDD